MAFGRFGAIAHQSGTPYGRFGAIAYSDLSVKSVGSSSGAPGDSVVIALGGVWDASGKTITLGGISVTPTAQNATSITFTVPTPYEDGSAYSALNLDTAYDLIIDDTGLPITASFTINSPSTGTYWYIPVVTGSPWNQGSIFYNSTNLADSDSAIVQVLAGGPMLSVSSDGSWISSNPIRFQAKGFNVSGWGSTWAEFTIQLNPSFAYVGPNVVSVNIPKDQPYTLGLASRFVGEISPYSITGTLPTGLTFNTDTGDISGTPTLAGTSSGIYVTASDGLYSGNTDTFTMIVTDYSGPGGYVTLEDYIMYLAYGVTEGHSINDAWITYLNSLGYTSGSLNDKQMKWLRDLGYTGALSDMLSKYMKDNNIL